MSGLADKMYFEYEAQKLIKKYEGYRDHIYVDSVGVLTGGYGHAFLKSSKLPKRIWEDIFDYDYQNAVSSLETLLMKEKIEGLSVIRTAVLLNMIFNLGCSRLSKFKRLFNALRNKDFNKAADEMLRSKWANQVDPVRGDNRGRADELARIMRENSWGE